MLKNEENNGTEEIGLVTPPLLISFVDAHMHTVLRSGTGSLCALNLLAYFTGDVTVASVWQQCCQVWSIDFWQIQKWNTNLFLKKTFDFYSPEKFRDNWQVCESQAGLKYSSRFFRAFFLFVCFQHFILLILSTRLFTDIIRGCSPTPGAVIAPVSVKKPWSTSVKSTSTQPHQNLEMPCSR